MTTDIRRRPETYTRRLHEGHYAELRQLLAAEPGATVFLSSNLERFGLSDPFIHFWGAFQDHRLVTVLMMVGQRAGIYTTDSSALRPIMDIALHQRLNFIMGPRETISSALPHLWRLPIVRSEAHFFAQLSGERFQGRRPEPTAKVGIRRATPDDIQALTTLYTGAAGFEQASSAQVRQSMTERVYALRSYVAEVSGRLVAGASTSAESYNAAMIGGVWTLPDERKQGYSTAVVAALSAELLAEGRCPYLFYLEDNAPAAHVYKKIGFQDIGHWTVVYFHRSRS
ncbi:MAG TPA: GNAT family N-acetyltransferase [Ktedonobacterales bacterium]